jgi:selenocysteine-specific elongation factor
VVTGVPLSGTVRAGDEVEVLPQGYRGKVRGLQAFGKTCEEGKAGHRIAVNVTDVDYRAIHRGCTLATPDYFEPSPFFDARFTYFESAAFPFKNRTEVKVHAGCAEEMGTVVLMDAQTLAPGQEGYIQVRLQRPMVVSPGDRFLIRRHSPALSLGGGTVIESSQRKAKRFKPHILEPLEAKYATLQENQDALIAFEMQRWPSGFFAPGHIAKAVGQRVETVKRVVEEARAQGDLLEVGRGSYLHRERFQSLSEGVLAVLEALHDQKPLKPYLDIKEVRNRLRMEAMALQNLLKLMEKENRIETSKGGWIRKAGFRVRLDSDRQRLADEILEALKEAGLSPPTQEALAAALGTERSELDMVADYLLSMEEIRLIAGFYFARSAIDLLIAAVKKSQADHGEVKIPLIRDTFSTSRKYLIPLMEYLDDQGITRREGERRFLKEA